MPTHKSCVMLGLEMRPDLEGPFLELNSVTGHLLQASTKPWLSSVGAGITFALSHNPTIQDGSSICLHYVFVLVLGVCISSKEMSSSLTTYSSRCPVVKCITTSAALYLFSPGHEPVLTRCDSPQWLGVSVVK